MNRLILGTLCALIICGCGRDGKPAPAQPNADGITVACYYFGNYHPGDPRNEKDRGEGWTEWNLLKTAKPRFHGHQQPKIPIWGYEDESDPNVMARKIDTAADYGIDAFIFDWYHYDDGPFLAAPIDNGFLKAPNNDRLKFAFMWANHDWLDIFPARKDKPPQVMYPGKVTPETFTRICDLLIADYFTHPSYWRIDGKPYFSIYDLERLMASFGGITETRAALDAFRAKATAAGLPGIHLNLVAWGQPILPNERVAGDYTQLVPALGFDSVTSYVWVHHVPLNDPVTDYNTARDAYLAYADRAKADYTVPYYPNVSIGWDPSPRCHISDAFGNFGYPFTNIIGNNTPANVQTALTMVKDRLLSDPAGPRILNINCWNEWTEGSHLEPDTRNGYRHLQAVKNVFRASP